VNVAACRAAFEQAELRTMVAGWGLSAGGAAAVCAAQPLGAEDAAARLLGAAPQPALDRDGLLALAVDRAQLEAVLGAKLIPSDWQAVERHVRAALRATAILAPHYCPALIP
jgi:hypothetical protein